jgi:hypothetical protein
MRVPYFFLELNETAKGELEQVFQMAKETHQDSYEE